MKKIANYLAATLFALVAIAAQAQEGAANLAPEPTVGVVWIGVFVALFVGLCIWFFVALLRNERKTKAAEDNAG